MAKLKGMKSPIHEERTPLVSVTSFRGTLLLQVYKEFRGASKTELSSFRKHIRYEHSKCLQFEYLAPELTEDFQSPYLKLMALERKKLIPLWCLEVGPLVSSLERGPRAEAPWIYDIAETLYH